MNDFLATLRQLGPARLAIMGGVLAGLLIFFIFVSMRISTPEFKPLYENLSTIDSSAMVSKLQEANIPYELSGDGSSIMTSAADIGRARMLLAQEGLPNGGSMGYELFDKQSSFGTTNFVQNINQVRALEGELARTIGSLDQVRSARVHLVLPQRELFSRADRPSSASVFLGLRPNMTLDREQILSIQSLVASAVPQLKAQNVAVIDSNGNLLARGGDDDNTLTNVKTEELRRNHEQRMTNTIEDIVGRVVGYGHVRANVTVDLSFDRTSVSQEIYDPEGQVARSTQVTEESGSERENANSGAVSVENNLPGIAGGFMNDTPTSQNNRVEETSNFEISKTVRNTVSEAGQLQRLSIGVLVDGTYTTNAEGQRTYQPRDQATLDQISALVKSAIGFNEQRGDTIQVVNMQFANDIADESMITDDRLFGFERSDLLDAAEIIAVAIMIILVVLLVVQPMIGRLLSAESPVDDRVDPELLASSPMKPALTGPSAEAFSTPTRSEDETLIDMSRVEGKVKASSVKKVEDIVNSYPAETVSVIRSWMSQES